MLPKVQAAMKFVRVYPDRKAMSTTLDKASDALEGRTGTVIEYTKEPRHGTLSAQLFILQLKTHTMSVMTLKVSVMAY